MKQAAPAVALVLAASCIGAAPAAAHPHVWVSVQTEVVYENGSVTGLKHRWTFDELYTAMAIEGLDKNGDGKYDRQELDELAKVNMDGLKEFDYFTYPKLGEAPIKLGEPKDAWLEHANGILSLHFFLPLGAPVLADAAGFNYSVYDPSFFIAFDLAKDKPVRLSAGAPAGCAASVGSNQAPGPDADAKRLEEAFLSQLGGTPAPPSSGNTVTVSCHKS